MIIDEIQRVPDLLSYLQSIVDNERIPGQFIITGSQNFLISEKISQSLAGRVAILNLLPFTLDELNSFDENINRDRFEAIYKGFFPPLNMTDKLNQTIGFQIIFLLMSNGMSD